MADEIERKFIVVNKEWMRHVASPADDIVQGYISAKGAPSLRVRVCRNVETGEERGLLTMKSKRKIKNKAISRKEYEYPIPLEDAKEMLATMCDFSIRKRRHYIEWEGREWTVDEFKAPRYHGLKLAEIELSEAGEAVELPPFVTAASEVTEDERFSNRYLADPANDLSFLKDMIKAASKGKGRG